MANKSANQILRELYLDYVNNYLSVLKFAEHNELTDNEAVEVLEMGRKLHTKHVNIFNETSTRTIN